MKITNEIQSRFYQAAKPMVEFLRENGHPHMTVTITQWSVELMEGLIGGDVEHIYTSIQKGGE